MNWKPILWTIGTGFLLSSPAWVQWLAPSLISTSNVDVSRRQEIVFWHFWGGPDRDVVEDVAKRFNDSQSEYFVRPVAMPGNNLQAKIFLAVAGGDPPDLVNQDDPILADWAERGIIQPMADFAPQDEVAQVQEWLFDSANRLSSYNGSLYGVCNGLDIRALYFNRTALEEANESTPQSLEQLTAIAESITPPSTQLNTRYAYIPDSRRLWSWGYVFGGNFYDSSTGELKLTSRPIVEALSWMQSFGRRYGPDNVAAFRKGDQSLPGKTFPLLPVKDNQRIGRYVFVMDGQWRVRDIQEFIDRRNSEGIPAPKFGVIPLPPPANGRTQAGWVNGNFFVVPQGAKNPRGSWEFIKFWIGFENTKAAVDTNIRGGWIPVSKAVVEHPEYQAYLDQQPLFRTFIDIASSPNQFPVPQVPGAAFFRRRIESAGYEAINHPARDPTQILKQAQAEIEQALLRKRNRKETPTATPAAAGERP